MKILNKLNKNQLIFENKSSHKNTHFNVSFIKHPSLFGHILCSIRYRNEHTNQDIYPRCSNDILMFTIHESEINKMDKHLFLQDNIITINKYEKINITCSREKYRSYTTGIEDARLWNNNYISGVSLYTNPNWCPEMVICKYDSNNNIITDIIPIGDSKEVKRPQKNWLFLKELNERITMIHSYKPFKVITCNKSDGNSTPLIIKDYKELNNIKGEIHGGSCLYLFKKKEYLVVVRIIKNHNYRYSLWLVLDEEYSIIKISKPFTFMKKKEYELIEYNKGFWYETCMCLMEKNDNEIYASLSISDCYNFIVTLSLEEIYNCFN